MKLLWRLSKEAIKYKGLYIIAILSTFCLTLINLAAPRALSRMTGIVSDGVTAEILREAGLALYGETRTEELLASDNVVE